MDAARQERREAPPPVGKSLLAKHMFVPLWMSMTRYQKLTTHALNMSGRLSLQTLHLAVISQRYKQALVY
jgi:hypothetical protein